MPRVCRLGALGLALIVVLAACAGPSPGGPAASGGAPAPAVKKRVVASVRGEPATLASVVDRASVGSTAGLEEVEELLRVGLAEVVDRRVVTRPRLAESAPTVENGQWEVFADGRMRITWRLRADARWHDGAPVTTADLLFTTQVGQDRDLPLLGNSAYAHVESVDAPDTQTVVVHWRRPYISADLMFASSDFALPLPRHILEPVYQQQKETFLEHPFWTTQYVGNGPFRLREFVRGSHLVMEANDGYVLGRPRLDEIEVRFIIDPTVIFANVLAGTVDITLGRGIAPEQGVEAERQWRAGKADVAYSTSWTALYPQHLNPDPPVLANPQFRRALMHALDRQQMVDTFAHGKTRVVTTFVGPSAPEFAELQPAAALYPFDPRRAIELIGQLGFTRGPDGVFVDSTGRPLSVEIRTTTGDDLRTNAMLASADMWKAVGIPTETVVIPRQRADDREYRVTRPGFELTHQPSDLTEDAMQRLQSKEIPTAENNWRGNNRGRYSNPEYDQLVDRYLVTFRGADRMELARALVRHVSEQLPAMGLMYRVDVALIADRLLNVTADRQTKNGHEWDLRGS